MVLLLVLMLGLNISKVLGLFGSGAILAMLSLEIVAVVDGYFFGDPGAVTKRVLALGICQRNMAATVAIATANFADQPDVLVFLVAAGLVAMIIVMPAAPSSAGAAKARLLPSPPHQRKSDPTIAISSFYRRSKPTPTINLMLGEGSKPVLSSQRQPSFMLSKSTPVDDCHFTGLFLDSQGGSGIGS